MKKVTPNRANGSQRTCWNCGKPFGVRAGQAEAIVGHDDRLYCDRPSCEQAALVPLIAALQGERTLKYAA